MIELRFVTMQPRPPQSEIERILRFVYPNPRRDPFRPPRLSRSLLGAKDVSPSPARCANPLATILLLLFTALPTLGIAAIAWRINQPGHVRDVEVELGRKLGMHVSLDATGYPAPGEVVYRASSFARKNREAKNLPKSAARTWSA